MSVGDWKKYVKCFGQMSRRGKNAKIVSVRMKTIKKYERWERQGRSEMEEGVSKTTRYMVNRDQINTERGIGWCPGG